MNNKLRANQIIIALSLITLVLHNIGLAQSSITNTKEPINSRSNPSNTKNKNISTNTNNLANTSIANKESLEIAPEAKSVDWYYERALVYYLREQPGRATIELYKALEKDPENSNVNYLLGILFKERKLWKEASEAFFKVTQVTKIEHIPARLELAFASVELANYQVVFLQLEKALQLMKLDSSYRNRLYQYQVDASTEKDSSNLKKKLKIDVKSSLESFIVELMVILLDTPESYKSFTTATGLNDPLIYNEIIQLYEEDGEDEEDGKENKKNDGKVLETLNEFLKKRNGFSPVILSQMGAIYQKQTQNALAIATYEKVIAQLTSLGFSEAAGDFSTEELQNLQAESKRSTSMRPTQNKRPINKNKVNINK
ncbi:MAG: hypothetical protein HY819_09620 [Acidobacteria bacterium]|nr:hypothetical protein [Acidobacteriota bacterium]